MSNILTDIVDDVQLKPTKMKLILKWVISISMSAIIGAFTIGQIKTARLNKLNSLESLLNANTNAMIELRNETKAGFEEVHLRIDKLYDDGFNAFSDFQEYNNKQLGLIIDYGKSDKEMLKRMLEITSMEKTKGIENQIEQAKNEKPIGVALSESSIIIKPVEQRKYVTLTHIVQVETKDTTFNVGGATQEFYNSIDRNKYLVGAEIESTRYPKRYDFSYRNK
jgi:hypothetical protein